MKFNCIHHVAVICSNYEVSKDFYTNILGLEVLQEINRTERQSFKLDLKVGDKYQIELFSFPNPPKRLSYPEAAGLRHLSFEVDDIEKAYTELKNKGVKVEELRVDETTNKRCFFFFDPDNLPLEVYQKEIS